MAGLSDRAFTTHESFNICHKQKSRLCHVGICSAVFFTGSIRILLKAESNLYGTCQIRHGFRAGAKALIKGNGCSLCLA